MNEKDFSPRIAVIGDFMLDVYIEGEVSRVSPEAPVPIVANPKRRAVPGGAANTAANAHTLGGSVTAVGIIGEDAAGKELKAELGGIGVKFIPVFDPRTSTTTKTRFLGNGHQVMRLDEELNTSDSARAKLLLTFLPVIASSDCVIISDYDKGSIDGNLAREVVKACLDRSIPVVVDSKKLDPSMFFGCTIIAPNDKEAFAMTGHRDPADAAESIRANTNSAVLVTRGPKGMYLLDGKSRLSVASVAQEVVDVSGAGDTVTAALAIGVSRGHSLERSVRYANSAAAIAVAHNGTYRVTLSDMEMVP